MAQATGERANMSMVQATVDLEHVLELPSGTLFGDFEST
jgi:hypothetical protein